MANVTIKHAPEIGRYRLYREEKRTCMFYDSRTRWDAREYAIGSLGMQVNDRRGILTDLQTGESWRIAVEITALTADDRADLNSAIRSELAEVEE